MPFCSKPQPEIPEKVESPNFADRLPEEIAPFTTGGAYVGNEGDVHLSFTQGAGHGGSHPHLVPEFVKMLCSVEGAYPYAVESANITCVGILAHESALKGGELVRIPERAFRSQAPPQPASVFV